MHGIYSQQRKYFAVTIDVFFHLIKKTVTIYPPSKERAEQEEVYEEVEQEQNHFIKKFHQLHTMGKRLLKRISIDSLCWQTSFGLGDAMQTGMGAGALWALKGGVVGFLSTYFALKKNVEIDVRPIFQGEGVYSEVKTTVSFRLFFIILSALPIYLYWREIKKKKGISNSASM